jgi:hypothetical protein
MADDLPFMRAPHAAWCAGRGRPDLRQRKTRPVRGGFGEPALRSVAAAAGAEGASSGCEWSGAPIARAGGAQQLGRGTVATGYFGSPTVPTTA